jgi:hypothetical protein
MGIFSSIKEKLWGKKAAPVETASTADASPVTADATKPVTADMSSTATTASMNAGPAGGKGTGTGNPVAATPSAAIDVAAILDAAVKKSGQKLDWKHSIVDLMKALDLDSSLSARKELAEELNYTGDKNDSAKMNVWLHKALMKALAENGGKIPAELLD